LPLYPVAVRTAKELSRAMQLPSTPKAAFRQKKASLRTIIALRISALFVISVSALSFLAFAYLERGLKRSIDEQHFAMVQWVIHQTWIYLTLGVAVATLIMLVMVWQLMKYLTLPLLKVIQQVEHMEQATVLTRPDTAGSSHEILTLTDAFNRMIETVQRQQNALQKNEERYRSLVESSPDAILMHREGVILFANSSALRLFRAERAEDLLGRTVDSIVHPEYRDLVKERIEAAKLVVGHTNVPHEEVMLRLDGTAVDVEAVGTQLTYQGKPAVQVILRDITARKVSELALRESEETLRDLMEVMPVGVALVEPDGCVAYLNRCFEEHFGYALAELPDLETWYALAYPDAVYREKLVAASRAEQAKAQADGTPIPPRKVNITCKDGSIRHIIINRQRAGNRSLVIFTDITARESQQSEHLKSQKLESLGVLAGGIAHDFNNILTGILGNITLAQLFLDQAHPSFKPLGYAERAASRAGELATQLLTFAKGGAPVKKIVALDVLVEEVVTLALRGANVIGKIRLAEGLHAIEADEGQMGQVFHNIVLNAVQAMPGGGTLVVSADNVTLTGTNSAALPPGNYVRVIFADEGHGMPEELQQKIFDPYFTTKPGGSGLGLASVHSIVKKHGGNVQVRSLVGRGTDFTFYLPSIGAVTPGPMEVEATAGAGRHAGGTVLVMDDDELIQTLTTQILEHLDYQVTVCANGEDAIALYGKAVRAGTPFLAAIMDLTIPGGMGGKEAAQQILALDPAARLIVSSGYSNDEVMADYTSYGFCAAIAKPYRVAELTAVLTGLADAPVSS
jgi:two-component system, cell cycle sensor histidine kinase and response regulator CckA